MAETLGILFLCACGLICVVIPCLVWLAFVVGVLCEAWGIRPIRETGCEPPETNPMGASYGE